MKEINKDFYCSAEFLCEKGECLIHAKDKNQLCEHYVNRGCTNYHRKHPTPEQFYEEYGIDPPDNIPVWVWGYFDSDKPKWELMEYWRYKQLLQDIERLDKDFDAKPEKIPCVIACTPFEKPSDDWRPE
jgi:hypothetical protein